MGGVWLDYTSNSGNMKEFRPTNRAALCLRAWGFIENPTGISSPASYKKQEATVGHLLFFMEHRGIEGEHTFDSEAKTGLKRHGITSIDLKKRRKENSGGSMFEVG